MTKLTQEELDTLRSLNNKRAALKDAIADTVLRQTRLVSQVDALKVEFMKKQNELIKKYGENASINLETGEVSTDVELIK